MPDNHEATLHRLIHAHQTELTRLCYAILHDRILAEDAVQETFVKAWRGLESFRGDALERTWLTRIAINTCRDLRRSAWFRLNDRRITPEMLPEATADATDADRSLTVAVMSLPIRLREAVLLYYYQELSMPQVAQVLGISHQAVSDRLARARRKLRAELERSL